MKTKVARMVNIHALIKLLPMNIEIKNRRVRTDEIMYFVECKSTGGAWVVSVARDSDLKKTVAAIRMQCLCGHGVSNYELEGCVECMVGS
jgi:prenyltransferase beta subunit